MDFMACKILQKVGYDYFDNIAGGETAGIPFAALIAERLSLPMTYVRKKPKGYGKNAQIEGEIKKNQKVLLVEDLTTDGGSKLKFVDAIRKSDGICNHTAVIFYYDIFKFEESALSKLNVKLHSLCTWKDIISVLERRNTFSQTDIENLKEFLSRPDDWRKKNA